MDKTILYKKAMEKFGEIKQLNKAIEELSELIRAISRIETENDKNNLSEELADVRIMIEQIERHFDLEDKVEVWKKFKLDRLEYYLTENEDAEI